MICLVPFCRNTPEPQKPFCWLCWGRMPTEHQNRVCNTWGKKGHADALKAAAASVASINDQANSR